MALTPADVHNVAFNKPPIGKRGYSEDEVDQFLDLVEAELARLIEENSDLSQRVSELESELSEAEKKASSASSSSAAPAAAATAGAATSAAVSAGGKDPAGGQDRAAG